MSKNDRRIEASIKKQQNQNLKLVKTLFDFKTGLATLPYGLAFPLANYPALNSP